MVPRLEGTPLLLPSATALSKATPFFSLKLRCRTLLPPLTQSSLSEANSLPPFLPKSGCRKLLLSPPSSETLLSEAEPSLSRALVTSLSQATSPPVFFKALGQKPSLPLEPISAETNVRCVHSGLPCKQPKPTGRLSSTQQIEYHTLKY